MPIDPNAKTHYETLGLPPTASQDDIKRRYRQLVKTLHPDVSKGKDSEVRFLAVSDAYGVLSDPMARNLYDADLLLAAAREKRAKTAPYQQSPPKSNPGSSSTATTNPPTSKPKPKKPSPRAEASALADQAKREFLKLKYRDAESLCRQAIQLDRRNSLAHEILGDVLLKRGQKDEAINEFSMAVQLDPTDYNLLRKFERLAGIPSSVKFGGEPGRYSQKYRSPRPPAVRSLRRLIVFIAIGVVMVAGFALILLLRR